MNIVSVHKQAINFKKEGVHWIYSFLLEVVHTSFDRQCFQCLLDSSQCYPSQNGDKFVKENFNHFDF